jgi:hypothetical protein
MWLVVAALLLPARVESGALPSGDTPPPSPATWTVWGADQYALADDGQHLWIGAVGGASRYDKQSGAYERLARADGLPHTEVRAIAVDAAGNRWFGGDGGLSRLDQTGLWTNFTAANSGLRADEVDALAVVGGDTLYAWHRTFDGSVSRLDANGTWTRFPNRESAAQSAYADIIGRGSSINPLWTVASTEVWIGQWVYDGAKWHDRPLPDARRVAGSVADGQGHVWAWTGERDTYEWHGAEWVGHDAPRGYNSRHITVLAVDRQGKVWQGLQETMTPYSPERAVVRGVDDEYGHWLDMPGPVSALLATAEGLWAIGPGWLMTPDFKVASPPDMPRNQDMWDAMADGGQIWLSSRPRPEYWDGSLQTLDDRGTTALQDDAWQEVANEAQPWCGRVTAFERFASDPWYATLCHGRVGPPPQLVRYHNGARIEYKLPDPVVGEVTDIFAEDARRIWLAMVGGGYGLGPRVLSLDDGGTPADFSDDKWQTLPVETSGEWLTIAVDA